MSNLKNRINKLNRRKQKERQRLNKKYNKLIEKLENQCENHEFGDWGTRPDNIHGGFQTSLYGDPILFRKCRICGKLEKNVPEPRKKR